MTQCLQQPLCKISPLLHSPFLTSPQKLHKTPFQQRNNFPKSHKTRKSLSHRGAKICSGFLPVDPWAPTIDSQSIASQLFAASLFPYLGFLYFITKSKSAPKLTLFGFYFLLAFVGATIPAGIYAKVHYGTSLSNVDWLHGGAELLLTLTNFFIVMGLREALRKAKLANESVKEVSVIKEDKNPSM
ncbi:hypothetical protein ACHQM5_000309 [Ranunculus cassubicifolius]